MKDSIIKRDGTVVPFDRTKITRAIFKAMQSTGHGTWADAEDVTDHVLLELERVEGTPHVEQIQDMVEKALMTFSSNGESFADVAEAYILYRKQREIIREEKKRIGVLQPKRVSVDSGNSVQVELKLKPRTVTNRSGQKEPIDITKIREVIEKACEGLSGGVDPIELELDSQIHFFDGISTKAIQETLIRVANEKASVERPNWTFVAARLLLHDLYKEARRNRHMDGNVYGHFPELVRYLTSIGRYDPRVLEEYGGEEGLRVLGSYIKPERDLLFNYPGLKHLSDRYAIRGVWTTRFWSSRRRSSWAYPPTWPWLKRKRIGYHGPGSSTTSSRPSL